MTVNLTRLALLVTELETTDKPQGQNALHDSKGFCCLGIACEVAMANGLQLKLTEMPNGMVYYDGCSSYLPASVREWFGFESTDPIFSDRLKRLPGDSDPFEANARASDLNDSHNLNFRQIAAEIRHMYEIN